MADQSPDQDALVGQFCGVTGAEPSTALQYLKAHDFNIESAIADFFAAKDDGDNMDEDSDDASYEDAPQVAQPIPTVPTTSIGGGRRLGDESDPTPGQASSSQAATSSSRKPPEQKKKFATIGDLSAGGHEGHGHGGDDSDAEDPKQDLFAGGEKSALAVQNPDDLKKKILEKAKRAQRRPEPEAKPRPSHFTGAARTLGGDDTPSETIEPPPSAPGSQRPPRVERVLHFWSDGFSIDDGELYRTDEPRHRETLEGIRQGRAPLSLMNVLPGQEVDVEIQQHSEPYVKPKKKYKPFDGSGTRLGSPNPGIAGSSESFGSVSVPTSTAEPTEAPKVEVDDAQPTILLQIRLGDGSRLTSRFNTTHTIGDVYSFVSAASPSSASRPWVLMTTFPSTELTDKDAILGDLAGFKRGGAVVQKWT